MRTFDLPERGDNKEGYSITPTTSLIDVSILDILAAHIISYPTLINFVSNDIKIPSVILTPSIIDRIQELANSESEFFLEAVNFLDVISLLDVLNFNGDGDGVINKFLLALKRNHENVGVNTDVMSQTTRPKATLSRHKDEGEFSISEHRYIVAVYIFALVYHLYDFDTVLSGGKRG